MSQLDNSRHPVALLDYWLPLVSQLFIEIVKEYCLTLSIFFAHCFVDLLIESCINTVRLLYIHINTIADILSHRKCIA